MELTVVIAVGIVIVVLLIVFGVPIYGSFFISVMVMLLLMGKSLSSIAPSGYDVLKSYLLLAVPLFIFAGTLMSVGGMAERLLRFAHALVGRIKGGLGGAGILASLMFGALTGSGLTAIGALGPVLIPRMERYGYERRYSTALLSASSVLGTMIPPSIMGILYGLVGGVSIGAIFLATAIPGTILALLYLVVNYFLAPRYMHPVSVQEKTDEKPAGFVRELGQSTFVAIPALLTPVIILGGIYGGIFTPTEAAAVASIYALLVAFLVYRQAKLGEVWNTLLSTGLTTGMIFIIFFFTNAWAQVLNRANIPVQLGNFVLGLSDNPYALLLLLGLMLVVMTMFIDGLILIMVIVPLLLPLINGMGVNPLHVGALVISAATLGPITPPLANCLFLGSQIGDVPYHRLIKPVLPFLLLAALPTLLIVALFPEVSLWLPRLVMGAEMVGW